MFSTTDTIVAIATPAGHGGIGVVRLSGRRAVSIATELTGALTPLRPRVATFAQIRLDTADSRPLDQVVLTWFRAPASYTGEDVVEIGAHGSPVVLRQIVERAVSAGARLAEPGEFTLRAYLAGRIDLVQAEAVADLIEAVTPMQARAAMDQLDGTLTRAIADIDAGLFDLIGRLEASLDFPDEGFHFITREGAREELGELQRRLDELAQSGRRGRMIREGALVAIAGRTNVGKSSLFNVLAGADRAIVTDVAGTTRDVLTERIDLDGLAVTIVDTAGLRESADAVELEGMRRARQAHDIARLVLIVLDGAAPLTPDDRAMVAERSVHSIVVASKADRPAAWSDDEAGGHAPDVVRVSAWSGAGIEALRRRMIAMLTGGEPLHDTPAITNVRHLTLVDAAREALDRAGRGLADGTTEELVLAELADARAALEAVVGRRAPDDLLHHIFDRFCVGK